MKKLILFLILAASCFWKVQAQCPDIPLEETYACKENILSSDFDTRDKAHDQLLLEDGTRVIAGITYAGEQMRLFIEELDLAGNTLRKQAYPIQGDDVSNVQIILDRETDEYILFFDTRISNDRDVYFVRIDRATLISLVQYYGPIVNDIAGETYSNEFAVKIVTDQRDRYMLVVNQRTSSERNSYVVMVDKSGGFFYCPSFIEINGSRDIISHDIIETGSLINNAGCAYGTSYVLVGSVDNFAFAAGLNCFGTLLPFGANIFDVDSNSATTDPAKRIQYANGVFYIAGETGSRVDPASAISGKIWLGSFSFNDEFHTGLNWLKIYEKNTGKKESLADLDYSDEFLYLTGQTEIEDVAVTVPGSTIGPKAYIFSTDLGGNPIWSKEYAEKADTESYLCDIELHCGAIYGVGGCNDRIFTSDSEIPGGGNITARNFDIYRNKTNLSGELSGDECYEEIPFEPIETQVPIELVQTEPFGECLEREPIEGYAEDLACVVECCGEEPPITWTNDCPIDVLFVLDNSGSIDNTEFNTMVGNINQVVGDINGKYTNAQYAITHYYGGCGNLYIEQDFSPTVTSITRQGSGNDDLNNALGLVIDAFGPSNPNILPLSATLNQRPSSDLYILIFTDAWHNATCGSAMLPYTELINLKNAPFNANVTLIHYSPNATVNPIAAAIASPGGTYTGTVDPPYSGPDGLTMPRQYIPWNFSSSDSIDICSTIPPCTPCVDCDSLMVRSNDMMMSDDGLCCYSIDLKNNTGVNIPVIEAEIISPDWGFATGSWQAGSGFAWCPTSPPNSQTLCLENASGIPPGWTNDALRYCLAPTVSNPSPTQQIVFTWKVANALGFEEVCKDTITVNCDIEPLDPCVDILPESVVCNPDNPYEFFFNFQIQNNSSDPYPFVNFSNSTSGELFQTCIGGSPVSSLSIPTDPPPLPAMTTGNTQCIKVISATPILSPTLMCFDVGIFDVDKCCNRVEQVCITLEPCCDPCEDNGIDYQFISVAGEDQCCVQVDLINECEYRYFTKVEANILTSGVTFGYHALGGPDAGDWSMCGSTPTSLCLEPNSGTIDENFVDDILQFCLDDIDDPSEVPQTIEFTWYTQNGNNEVVACTDIIVLDCPAVDNRCLEITNDTLVCTDVPGVYDYTFTVTNVSSIPFCATDMDLFIAGSSDLVFTSTSSIIETIPFSGSGLCSPLSETLTTSFTDSDGLPTTGPLTLQYRLRYATGDTCCYESEIRDIAIPICCDSTELVIDGDFDDPTGSSFTSGLLQNCTCAVGSWCIGTTPRDKCNNSAWGTFGAPAGCSPNFLIVDASGTLPTTIWSQPVTVDAGSTYEFSFWYYPNVSGTGTPNLDIRLATTLVGSASGVVNTWTQYTFTVVAPVTGSVPLTITQTTNSGNGDFAIDHISFREDCDPECCTNYDEFCDRVDTGFAIAFNDPTNCTVGVSPLALNECDRVRWIWGDGSVSNGTWNTSVTHTYPGPGAYTICMIVSEVDANGEVCWEKEHCMTIEAQCGGCCTSFDEFCDRVDTGFAIAFNNPTNCTVGVSPLALNECDQVRWLWGDGTSSSSPWNTSVTHTYSTPGTYTICMIVQEVGSNGEVCWEKEFCREVQVNCLHWEKCDPVIDLGDLALPSGTIHAQEEVISSGTIEQGTDVSLRAGECIRLDGGFSSELGADLEILIEDCVLTGEVLNINHAPIPGVLIKQRNAVLAVTAADGTFELESELAEGDVLTFEKEGFVTVSKVYKDDLKLTIFMKDR